MEDEGRLFSIAEGIEATIGAVLSPAQNIFKFIWELEAQVNNGGFHQYFYNGSGRSAPKVEEALRAIGANKCADITSKALKLIDGGNLDWGDDNLRRSYILSIAPNTEEALCELDQQFYGYPDPLSDLLGKFVLDHPNEF